MPQDNKSEIIKNALPKLIADRRAAFEARRAEMQSKSTDKQLAFLNARKEQLEQRIASVTAMKTAQLAAKKIEVEVKEEVKPEEK